MPGVRRRTSSTPHGHRKLHVTRTCGLVVALEFTPIETGAWRARCGARDVVRRRRRHERRQVLAPRLSRSLEPRRELDENRLAERGAEETDAEGQAEHAPGRYLDHRIPGRCGQTGTGELEVVAEQKIGYPGRRIGRRDHGVELKITDRLVDAIDA